MHWKNLTQLRKQILMPWAVKITSSLLVEAAEHFADLISDATNFRRALNDILYGSIINFTDSIPVNCVLGVKPPQTKSLSWVQNRPRHQICMSGVGGKVHVGFHRSNLTTGPGNVGFIRNDNHDSSVSSEWISGSPCDSINITFCTHFMQIIGNTKFLSAH